MERDSFIFYRSFRLAAQALSKEERADLYDAICDYALDGTTPESFEGAMLGIFYMARMQIDINNEKYRKKIEARREAGRKSGEARRNEQTGTKRTVNVNVNGNVNENIITPPKSPSEGEGEEKARFEAFWKAYPKQKSKDAAWRAVPICRKNLPYQFDGVVGFLLLSVKKGRYVFLYGTEKFHWLHNDISRANLVQYDTLGIHRSYC